MNKITHRKAMQTAANEADPIFALIQQHRVDWANYEGATTDAELNRTHDIACVTIDKLLVQRPTTPEGAIALANYMREFFKKEERYARKNGLYFTYDCDAGLGLIPNEWPWRVLDAIHEHFGSKARRKAA